MYVIAVQSSWGIYMLIAYFMFEDDTGLDNRHETIIENHPTRLRFAAVIHNLLINKVVEIQVSHDQLIHDTKFTPDICTSCRHGCGSVKGTINRCRLNCFRIREWNIQTDNSFLRVEFYVMIIARCLGHFPVVTFPGEIA